MATEVTLTCHLSDDQAQALAQFVKRVDRGSLRQWAANPLEADDMFDALIGVRQGLVEAGYAPR